MSDIVKQSDVLKAVIAAVAKEFSCPVYSDEVHEDYKKPCFFIAASSRMTTKANNWLEKTLEMKLTYYAKDERKNEVAYMDVIDRVQLLFQSGIQTDGGRYLHIDTVEDDRAGEENDILTILITINYIEKIIKSVSSIYIDEVDVNYQTGGAREDEETWKQTIGEE
ncbi:MAG: hypothetical protein MSA50_03805 [Veillonellaceae bacterium]|nr:hypothetical protein [Veillonellaceae bacterium]